MNVDEANEALNAVASARRSLATASAAPLWRHAAFALMMALMILSVARSDLRIAAWLGAMAGLLLILAWDRRQTGMFVNGYRRGRTLPLTIALVIVMVGLAIVASRLVGNGEPMLALLTVPAAFFIALAASLAWERIFLAEMGAGR